MKTVQGALVLFLGLSSFLFNAQASLAADAFVTVTDRPSFDAAILKASLNRDGTKIVVLDDQTGFESAIDRIPDLMGALAAPSEHWNDVRQHAYANGDMYILWGDLDDTWTESEYDKFYHVTKYLVKHGFRALINPVAYEKDVREAVTSPTTAGILWSSHGDTDGKIYDSGENPMTPDVFFTNSSLTFRQLVLSSCYGEASDKYYRRHARLHVHHWTGKTTTPEYFEYLDGGNWQKDLEKDLSIKLVTTPVPNDKP